MCYISHILNKTKSTYVDFERHLFKEDSSVL